MLEVPHHRDDQGHMGHPEDLKPLLLPTRDDAVAAVCPPPGHSQSVEAYPSHRPQMIPAHNERQSEAIPSPEVRDRSRLEPSAGRGNEAIETPHTVQERHDDSRIALWEVSEGSGAPGGKDHDPSELHFLPWSIPTAAVR